MGGFVVFEEDRAWGVSNAAWRATVTPAVEVLPEGSAARLRIEHAVRGAIHYLDLTDAPPPLLAEIKLALGEVLVQYERGDRSWGDEAQTSSFLWLFRGLLTMFDDLDMGVGPCGRTRSAHRATASPDSAGSVTTSATRCSRSSTPPPRRTAA